MIWRVRHDKKTRVSDLRCANIAPTTPGFVREDPAPAARHGLTLDCSTAFA